MSGLQYEAVITTYFSKAIYTDCWSQRGERQKQNVSLFFFPTMKELLKVRVMKDFTSSLLK